MKSLLRQITKVPGVRQLWRRFPIGSVELRVDFDIWNRPAYAYGVYAAAHLARALGHRSIAAIEFGVARGDGLVALEHIAQSVAAALDVRISTFGFDTGEGMPAPADYRDLPHVWGTGFYRMDEAALHSRLKTTRLVLGNVGETISRTLAAHEVDTVGFVSFDLDYYSSTRQALRIFDAECGSRLPRVFCYFDDLIWPERACYNPYTGEYLAIQEFNGEHEHLKLAQIPNLSWMRNHAAFWNEQMYVLHDFSHPEYCKNITPEEGQQQ